jgi:hypothetical protein
VRFFPNLIGKLIWKVTFNSAFLMGGRKMTKIGCFDPPRPPPGTPQGGPRGGVPGGPRVRAASSARNFNLVLISPLGFAFSDRNPTKLTKNTKKVSFGRVLMVKDMKTRFGPKLTKIDQILVTLDPLGPPLGPPRPPTPPLGPLRRGPDQKNTKFSTFLGKTLLSAKIRIFLTFLPYLAA